MLAELLYFSGARIRSEFRCLWVEIACFFAQRPSRPKAVLSTKFHVTLDELVVLRTYAALHKAAKESYFKRSP